MASDVKAWSLPVEDFRLRLTVTTGTLDPCLLTTPRSFGSWLQHPGCTKHVIKVQVRGSLKESHDCRAFRPAPSKLTRSPRRLFKTISSRSVKRARSAHGSMRGQPRGTVAVPINTFQWPSRTGGQSKPVRSGTLAYGYLPGSLSQTTRFSQHPWLRSSQVGLRSASSSPARSAWRRHGSGMVGSLVGRVVDDRRGSHGTSWPRR